MSPSGEKIVSRNCFANKLCPQRQSTGSSNNWANQRLEDLVFAYFATRFPRKLRSRLTANTLTGCLRPVNQKWKFYFRPYFFSSPGPLYNWYSRYLCRSRPRAVWVPHFFLKKFKAFLASSFVRGVLRSTTALVYKLFIRRCHGFRVPNGGFFIG